MRVLYVKKLIADETSGRELQASVQTFIQSLTKTSNEKKRKAPKSVDTIERDIKVSKRETSE